MLQPGTIVDDRYEIRRLIGSGGMGAVYEAYQTGLDRLVAVKILTSIAPEAADDLLRFEREAVILSRFNHPNIVKFYAYGEFQKLPFIVMERLHGESLQTALFSSTPPAPQKFLNYAIEICRGLECAHDSGIFHRDVKPSNVILDTSTTNGAAVKLIDFGLAKLSLEWQAQKLTQTGLAVGSVMYMSPEQCTGQGVDARSDVYSVGCLLFHGLTGLPPFCADEAIGIMFQHLNLPINEAQGWDLLSPPLQALIEKCMSKDKSKRYSNMAQVREELENLIASQRVKVSSTPSISRPRPRKFKVKIGALIVVAGVAISAGVVALNWQQIYPTETVETSPDIELANLGNLEDAESATPAFIARLERCIQTCKDIPGISHDRLLAVHARLGTAYLENGQNQKAKQILEDSLANCDKATQLTYKIRLLSAVEHQLACNRLNVPMQGKAMLEKSLEFSQFKHSSHYSRAEMALASLYLHDRQLALAKSRFQLASEHLSIMRGEELKEGMELAIRFGNPVKLKSPEWIRDDTPLSEDTTPFSQLTAIRYLHSFASENDTHLCNTPEAAKVNRALEIAKNAPVSTQRDLLQGYRMLEYFYSNENNYRSAAAVAKEGMDLCTTIRPESRALYAHLACMNYTDVVMRNLEKPNDHYVKIALRNLPQQGSERAELQLVAAGIALKKNDLQTAHGLFVQCAQHLTTLTEAVEISIAFDLARQFGINMFEQKNNSDAVKKS